MTNQTMRDCRTLVDARIAVARRVVTSQCLLIETLRRHRRPTSAAEIALARYCAVSVLHTPRDEQLRSMYDTLSFFAPCAQMDEFVPTENSLASPG